MENRVVNTVTMLASGTEKRVAERSSSSLTVLRNMFDPETQPTVMWQNWDAIREITETPPVLYVVGSAGSAAGIISFGYLLWILRGSTFITLLTSRPRWRMVDPTAILSAYRGSIDYEEDRMKICWREFSEAAASHQDSGWNIRYRPHSCLPARTRDSRSLDLCLLALRYKQLLLRSHSNVGCCRYFA